MMKTRISVLCVFATLVLCASAVAAPPAASYKSTAAITSLGPGSNVCPANQFPVSVAGNGIDLFGIYTLTEQLCADPVTGAFEGQFEITHKGEGSYSGVFNGTFFPSGELLEVHATWRIAGGSGAFSHLLGAGTGKGTATVVNGGPGPGTLLLDGSILIPDE